MTNFLAVLCIIGWRFFWLTMVKHATPEAPVEIALTKTEILDRIALSTTPHAESTVLHYLVMIAKLGGYLHARRTRRGTRFPDVVSRG